MANDNLQKVQQVTKQQTIYAISTFEQNNFNQLKIVAQQYINKIEQLKNNLQKLEKNKQYKNTISGTIRNIADAMSHNDNLTKIIFQETNIFKQALNHFLGREIPLTYISEDGTILALSSYTERQLYNKNLTHNSAGRGRMKNFQQALDGVKIIESEVQKIINERTLGYKHIFTQAIRRSSKNQEEMDYSPSARTYYWRLYDYHITNWSKVMQINEIAEQYADIVLNRTEQFNTEYGLKMMSDSFQGHNWTRAIKTGDVDLNIEGQKISLAIKFGNQFQTQGFRQYCVFAYNILNINYASPTDIENNIVALSRGTGKTAQAIINNLNIKANNLLVEEVSKIKPIININSI